MFDDFELACDMDVQAEWLEEMHNDADSYEDEE
jgi:hypothetical protein